VLGTKPALTAADSLSGPKKKSARLPSGRLRNLRSEALSAQRADKQWEMLGFS